MLAISFFVVTTWLYSLTVSALQILPVNDLINTLEDTKVGRLPLPLSSNLTSLPNVDITSDGHEPTANSSALTPRAYTYDPDKWFDFINFPAPPAPGRRSDAKQIVINSILAARLMLHHTLTSFAWEKQRSVSFQRYFNPGDFNLVYETFLYILAGTGGEAPYLDTLRQCRITTPTTYRKVQIAYGDHPRNSEAACTTRTSVSAYTDSFFDATNILINTTSLCPSFFTTARPLTSVDPANFYAFIEKGCYWRFDEPSYSTGNLFLHELLHADTLSQDARGHRHIEDVSLQVPGVGVQVAYGAYHAERVKSSGWVVEGRTTTDNVDNYVYLTMELYYKRAWGRGEFQYPPVKGYTGETDPCGMGRGGVGPVPW